MLGNINLRRTGGGSEIMREEKKRERGGVRAGDR
jgi:hypothetical protein